MWELFLFLPALNPLQPCEFTPKTFMGKVIVSVHSVLFVCGFYCHHSLMF